MSKHMISKNVKCPFYKHEDAQVIYCDGVQDGSVVHLAFASKSDAKEYKGIFCKDDYETCRIYAMLYEKEYTR